METYPELLKQIENVDSFDFDSETNNLMSKWQDYGIIVKDISEDCILRVKSVQQNHKNRFTAICENGTSVVCNFKQDIDFFKINGFTYNTVQDFLDDFDYFINEYLIENKIFVKILQIQNNAVYGSLSEATKDVYKEEFFKEKRNPQKVYMCKIIDKNRGGFLVNILGVTCFLPGGLAAANKINNFDSYIGKTIPVMIEDYIHDGDIFVVSHKKYINKVLPEKLNAIDSSKIYEGKITGTADFGIFIEFDEFLTGLLHIHEMTDDFKFKFQEDKSEFVSGDDIKFYVKKVQGDNRIILSQKEPIIVDNVDYEKFKENFENKEVLGTISNINNKYGIFVNFNFDNNSYVSLLHYKTIWQQTKTGSLQEFVIKNNLVVGSDINVLVSTVDVENERIFLALTSENLNKQEVI